MNFKFFMIQVSMLPWYLRKIAAAVYGEPPNSSVDEALGYAMKVIKVIFFFLNLTLYAIDSTFPWIHQGFALLPIKT